MGTLWICTDLILLCFSLLHFADIAFFTNWKFAATPCWANILTWFSQQLRWSLAFFSNKIFLNYGIYIVFLYIMQCTLNVLQQHKHNFSMHCETRYLMWLPLLLILLYCGSGTQSTVIVKVSLYFFSSIKSHRSIILSY